MKMIDAVLALSDIHPDPHQPRQQFDEAKERELVESIRAHGLLQPILVRLDDERVCYLIVSGERRYRAGLKAGLAKVPVRIIDGELTPAALLLIQLTENLDRDDLKPMELAQSLQRLQRELDCSRDELARRIGKSPASVSRWLSLLELPEDLQGLVDSGQLPGSIAAELVRCSSPAVQREIATAVIEGKLNRVQAVQAIQSQVGKRTTTKAARQHLTVVHASGIRSYLSLENATTLDDWEMVLGWLLQQCRKVQRNGGTLDDLKSRVQAKPTTKGREAVTT